MVALRQFASTVYYMHIRESALKLDLDSLILPAVQQDLVIREPSARSWLQRLPSTLKEVCDMWQLTPLEALHGGRAGCVLKVESPERFGEGNFKVLKITLSSGRATQEAAALECFAPGGVTPTVAGVDPAAGALLMDWVKANTTLRAVKELSLGALPPPDEIGRLSYMLLQLRGSSQIVGNNLELLAVPTLEEFHNQRLHAAGALREVARGTRPPTPADLRRAIATLEFLEASGRDTRRTLIHGDLNSGNVLGGSAPLIAIDPRPLRGDPAYDTAVLALKRGEKVAEKTARLLASVTGDDLERVLCWLFIARVSRI